MSWRRSSGGGRRKEGPLREWGKGRGWRGRVARVYKMLGSLCEWLKRGACAAVTLKDQWVSEDIFEEGRLAFGMGGGYVWGC